MTEAAKMTEKYADLRSLAEAATPGPWDTLGGNRVRAIKGDFAVPIFESLAPVDWHKKKNLTHKVMCAAYANEVNNASFIAAANPTAVLALLDERASLLKALEGAKAVLEGDDPHDGNRADVALDVIDAAPLPAPRGKQMNTAEKIARVIEPDAWLPIMAFHKYAGLFLSPEAAIAKRNEMQEASLDKAHAILSLIQQGEPEDFRWLIEAPGQRYLGTRTLGGEVSFHWTTDHNEALAFHSEAQADAAMMAVRTLNSQAFGNSHGLFGFETSLGNAKAIEHAWLSAAPLPTKKETALEREAKRMVMELRGKPCSEGTVYGGQKLPATGAGAGNSATLEQVSKIVTAWSDETFGSPLTFQARDDLLSKLSPFLSPSRQAALEEAASMTPTISHTPQKLFRSKLCGSSRRKDTLKVLPMFAPSPPPIS